MKKHKESDVFCPRTLEGRKIFLALALKFTVAAISHYRGGVAGYHHSGADGGGGGGVSGFNKCFVDLVGQFLLATTI